MATWPRYVDVRVGYLPATEAYRNALKVEISTAAGKAELEKLRLAYEEELKTSTVAHVRVITHHPDDAVMMEKLRICDMMWDWCDKREEAIQGGKNLVAIRCPGCNLMVDFREEWKSKPMEDTGKLEEKMKELIGVETKRNKSRLELFHLVLKDKHGDDAAINNLLAQCSLQDVLNIFWAAKGAYVPAPSLNGSP